MLVLSSFPHTITLSVPVSCRPGLTRTRRTFAECCPADFSVLMRLLVGVMSERCRTKPARMERGLSQLKSLATRSGSLESALSNRELMHDSLATEESSAGFLARGSRRAPAKKIETSTPVRTCESDEVPQRVSQPIQRLRRPGLMKVNLQLISSRVLVYNTST